MKNKIIFASLFIIIFLAVGVSVQAVGQTPSQKPGLSYDLPEQDGTYDVPGHSNIKLRVIVHHGKPVDKPAKPAPYTPILECNLPDQDSTAEVSPAGWVMPSTWTYNLNPQSVPSSVKGSLETIAGNAFAPWKSAVGDVVLTKGPDTTVNKATFDGKNIITWGRTSGTALATTYIWYNTNTSPYTVVELDTVMNNKFTWAWSNPDNWSSLTQPGTTCAYKGVYDAQDIMTHELGHWYGLDDEYTNSYVNNTMYGYGYTGQTSANTLTTGDISGVQKLYK